MLNKVEHFTAAENLYKAKIKKKTIKRSMGNVSAKPTNFGTHT